MIARQVFELVRSRKELHAARRRLPLAEVVQHHFGQDKPVAVHRKAERIVLFPGQRFPVDGHRERALGRFVGEILVGIARLLLIEGERQHRVLAVVDDGERTAPRRNEGTVQHRFQRETDVSDPGRQQVSAEIEREQRYYAVLSFLGAEIKAVRLHGELDAAPLLRRERFSLIGERDLQPAGRFQFGQIELGR